MLGSCRSVEGCVRVPPLRLRSSVASVPPLQSHPEAILGRTSLFAFIILCPTYQPYVILDTRSQLRKVFTIQTTDRGCENERGLPGPLVGHLLSQAIGSSGSFKHLS